MAKALKKAAKKPSRPAAKAATRSPSSPASSSKDLQEIRDRLTAIEAKLELLGGITREYLEENFSKLNSFDDDRRAIVKILDRHESRINTLEGF